MNQAHKPTPVHTIYVAPFGHDAAIYDPGDKYRTACTVDETSHPANSHRPSRPTIPHMFCSAVEQTAFPPKINPASHHVFTTCTSNDNPTRSNPGLVKLRHTPCSSVIPSHHVNASWAWPFSLLIGNRVSIAVRQRRYLQEQRSHAVAAFKDS